MQPNWVDFKAVKQAVTMRMVLDHYAIDWLRKKGSELYGRCPIHKGTSEDSFNVNSEKNCFALLDLARSA
jgi:DNA primase